MMFTKHKIFLKWISTWTFFSSACWWRPTIYCTLLCTSFLIKLKHSRLNRIRLWRNLIFCFRTLRWTDSGIRCVSSLSSKTNHQTNKTKQNNYQYIISIVTACFRQLIDQLESFHRIECMHSTIDIFYWIERCFFRIWIELKEVLSNLFITGWSNDDPEFSPPKQFERSSSSSSIRHSLTSVSSNRYQWDWLSFSSL